MAISFNGTTLSNTINAVMFNGTAVSKVMFNGTEVWAKLLNLNWSGNSHASTNGISVSGNLFRAHFDSKTSNWITTEVTGTFTGDSDNGNFAYLTSGNLIKVKASNVAAGAWVTYTLANKSFTGSSTSRITRLAMKETLLVVEHGLHTSGGLIRTSFTNRTDPTTYGAYISLK